MKTILFCLIMISFCISSYGQKKSPNIEGTWKMVQSRTINGSKSVIDFPGKKVVDETKIWSGNNFMFIARAKTDTLVEDVYGVGTYKLQGNKYEENIRIMNYKPWEGKTI